MSDQPNKPSWWAEWSKLLREPAVVGGLLLTGALLFNHAWIAGVGIIAVFLLGTRRVFRELVVVAVLLGATFNGFSKILGYVLAAGDIHPGKTAIVIAVVLAWTILVALCLGRLHGSRDEE